MHDSLRVAAACLAFAFVHSIMVADFAKKALARTLGMRFMQKHYRLAFTTISIASTAAAAYIIYVTPDTHIWGAPLWLHIMMQTARALALLFAALSFRGFSLGEFTGITQTTRSNPEGDIEGMISSSALITTGGYAVVRNPLYFAGIVIMSLDPTISRNGLVVSVMADLYFIFGALIEERRMKAHFGRQYIEYMKHVPLLLPNPVKFLMFLLRLKA